MICILQNLQLQILQNQFTMLPVGFEHSQGAKSSNRKILRKLSFSVRISYFTYLPTEVDERVITELYFLDKNLI